MECDVLIAGAGCAGLSLAVHLLEAGATDLDVLLLEPREVHVRDRTWCYWPVLDHPFEAAVRHAWFRWRVRTDAGDAEAGSPTLGYRCLPSDAFYDMALRRLEKAPNVELRRGVVVDGFRPAARGVVGVTSEGEVRARQAFDGRPPPAPPGSGTPGEVEWVQHFVGLEVETETPIFDPSVATLMDFRRPGRGGGGPPGDIRFMYVLPFDERRALLEDTFFGGEPRGEAEYVGAIDAYLDERLGAGRWRELHRERGAIPMRTTPAAAPSVPRVTAIGVRAGLARPSTGYAFLAIQRQASRLAAQVALEGLDRTPSRGRPYGGATAFLDRVFLSYLEREPGAAPALFRSLFAGVAPHRLARFMFDGGTPADRLAVMRALPPGPLARQALRVLGPAARDLFRRV